MTTWNLRLVLLLVTAILVLGSLPDFGLEENETGCSCNIKVTGSKPSNGYFIGERVGFSCSVASNDKGLNPDGVLYLSTVKGSKLKSITNTFKAKNHTAIVYDFVDVISDVPPSVELLQYMCFCRGFGEDCTENSGVLLNVENELKPVENISCSLFNWDNLACKLQLGVKYRSTRDLHVTLTGSSWHGVSDLNLCQSPVFHDTTVTCTSRVSDAFTSSYNESSYAMHIQLTKYDRTVASKVNTSILVQPAAVRNVKSINETPTSLMLQWEPTSWRHRVKYSITCQSLGLVDDRQEFVIKPDVPSTQPIRMSVTNLAPFHEYNLSVRAIPIDDQGEDKGLYSEAVFVTARTEMGVPKRNPTLHPGSFWCSNGCSSITVFWETLSKVELQGPLKAYHICFKEGNNTNSCFETIKPLLTYPTKSHSDVLVKLWVETPKGVPNGTASFMKIFKDRTAIPEDAIAAEVINDTTINVHLYPYKLTSSDFSGVTVTDITVFQRSVKYETQLEISEKFPFNAKDNTGVSISTKLSLHQYTFGVSIEAISVSNVTVNSGITWVECLYPTFGIPEVPVVSTVEVLGKGFKVSWREYTCSESHGPALHYRLEYCLEAESCAVIAVPPGAGSFTVHPLPAGKYLWNVRGVFPAGLSSLPMSLNTILIKGEDDSLNLLSLLFLLLLAPLGLAVYKFRRKKCKKFEIYVPDPESSSHVIETQSPGNSSDQNNKVVTIDNNEVETGSSLVIGQTLEEPGTSSSCLTRVTDAEEVGDEEDEVTLLNHQENQHHSYKKIGETFEPCQSLSQSTQELAEGAKDDDKDDDLHEVESAALLCQQSQRHIHVKEKTTLCESYIPALDFKECRKTSNSSSLLLPSLSFSSSSSVFHEI